VLIGPGTVLNPEVLAQEMDMLAQGGIMLTPEKLGVDAKTSIIMPYHVELDGLRESKRAEKIGTTKRGIGFAYIDKVARDEVRMADLVDPERLRLRLLELAPSKEAAIRELEGDPAIVTSKDLMDKYLELGRRLAPYVTDVSYEVNKAIEDGKNVLAEGAQGTHLDVIHGTQKFVTSSSTVAGSACANLGVGPTKVDEVLGIVKAYITRVGEGPLPTELTDETGRQIQQVGKEFGTTTGRERRCGWFDLPLLRKAIYLNGYTSLALTKLDVLSGLDEVRVCVSYELESLIVDYPPEGTVELSRCKPVYENLPGWESDLTGVKSFGDLPEAAQNYVLYLERKMGVPITYISVGPGREQTFRK
jgi:adenylosuccinate synthase